MIRAEEPGGTGVADRLRRLLVRLPVEDHENLYVILGDFAAVREILHLSMLLRQLLRNAPKAMVEGKITSDEYVAASSRIRRDMVALRKDCEALAVSAGLGADLSGIRGKTYYDEAEAAAASKKGEAA